MLLRNILIAAPFAVFLVAACGGGDDQNGFPTSDKPVQGSGGPGDPGKPGGGPAVTKDLCKIEEAGDGGKVIKATLLLPESPALGELFIDAKGTIVCADKDCSKTSGYGSATKIACKDAVVSPGLINPHDHISYANNPPHAPQTERYEHRHDWRLGIRGHHKIPKTGKSTPNAVDAAELRFVMSGVTAIAGASGGAPGLARNVDDIPASLEGLPIKLVSSDTFPLDDNEAADPLPTACEDFTGDQRKTSDAATRVDAYLPHIAEGIDDSAHAEFVCQSDDATRYDLIKRQTAVVHGVAVTPNDVAQYREDGSTLIWSPRSNIDLYGNTAPIILYANMGVPIALGTDWLISGSMNMSRELHCADDLNNRYFGKRLTDKQLWQMVTSNAALAIGASRVLGSLKPGYVADIAIFDAKGKTNPYRAVIEASPEDTVLVMRGGKALYGDSAIVKEAGAGGGADCEDIEVCGFTKKACVKKDLGKKTLADLKKAADAVYPLFYCKDAQPKDEPSCAPSREATAGQPKVSVYSAIKAGDKDGDGVPDADDNCPDVFNPIRPMDNGKQADTDGDDIGDACDKCPLEAGEGCTQPDADDMDGDGIRNADDNCPKDANADQADADHDGKGAACDKDGKGAACDDRPNPGATSCPTNYTIAQIRRPNDPQHPKVGTRAIVENVWVTAVKDVGTGGFGFFVQEAGSQYAGIFVFTGTTVPTVKVGNKVTVEGDYEEYKDQSELSNAIVRANDNGTDLPIQPVSATPATFASVSGGEPYESMLCVVNGPVSVTKVNADGNTDRDEFAVTSSSLRIDDYIYDALDNIYPLGTSFQKIVGICGYSIKTRKIWPRTADDLTQ
jgi:cytosine/adenosine deaminase-related metal-dependent hydrolase